MNIRFNLNVKDRGSEGEGEWMREREGVKERDIEDEREG